MIRLKLVSLAIAVLAISGQALAQLNSSTPAVGNNNLLNRFSALAHGPSNSLYAYWTKPSGVWEGPWGVYGGRPNLVKGGVNMAVDEKTGLGWATIRGMNDAAYVLRQNANLSWQNPSPISGAGSCLSDPDIAYDRVSGNMWATWRGPNGTIWLCRKLAGTWRVPFEPRPGFTNLCVGNPSLVVDKVTHQVTIGFRNPDDSGSIIRNRPDDSWYKVEVATPGSVYSDLGMCINTSAKRVTIAFKGESYTLKVLWSSVDTWYIPITLAGGCDATPTIDINPVTGLETILVVGASNSLRASWRTGPSSWSGPLGLRGGQANTAYSVPAMVFKGQMPYTIAVGPTHSLWAFWQPNPASQWFGPLGVAPPNTAY